MEVRKSEGYFEEYNPSKVKHGICEAYTVVNEVCPDGHALGNLIPIVEHL